MNYDLCFQDRFGDLRLIQSDITGDDEVVMKRIKEYIKEISPNFKIYYVRSWTENNVRTYDVGSHTEFFKLIPKLNLLEK